MGKFIVMTIILPFLAMLSILMNTFAMSSSVPLRQLMPSSRYPNAMYGRPVQLNRHWNMKTSRCGEKDIWLRADCHVVTEKFINFPHIQQYFAGYKNFNVRLPFFKSCVFTETTGVVQTCGKAYQIVERKNSTVGFCNAFCKPRPFPKQVIEPIYRLESIYPIPEESLTTTIITKSCPYFDKRNQKCSPLIEIHEPTEQYNSFNQDIDL